MSEHKHSISKKRNIIRLELQNPKYRKRIECPKTWYSRKRKIKGDE